MFKKVLVISFIAILSSSAMASKQRSFDKLDGNQDQQLSLKEFLKFVKNTDRMTKVFKFRDKNGDGILTRDEYQLKKKKRKKQKSDV